MATQTRVPLLAQDPAAAYFEKLPFYASAEYWDGEAMRQGDIHPDPVIDSCAALLFAAYKLRQRAGQGFPRQGVRTYERGEVFKADDYISGTVMAFHQESVSPRDNLCRVVDMNTCETEDLPEPPSDLSFSLAAPRLHLPTSSKRTGLIYSHNTRIGIITKSLAGKKFLYSVRAYDVYYEWLGKLKTPIWYQAAEPTEIEIGRTMHFGKKLGDFSERLYRINSLEVYRLGRIAAENLVQLNSPAFNS